MSEPENLINVEDEPAASEPVSEVAPAAQTVAEAAPPESDADIDINAIDLKDEGRVRGLIGELSRKRAENRTLKTQAERASALETELNQARPYLEFMRNNPQLLQPRQPEPQAPPPPDADPRAVQAARLMDFYTADGKPDVNRGAEWIRLQEDIASGVAQKAMAPTVQQSLQDKAQSNYTMLRNFKLPDGKPLRQDIVDGIWQAAAREPNGLATLANPQSVQALALLAIGAHSLSVPGPTAPPALTPPVVTEPVGGRATTPQVRLSGIEERTLKQSNLSPTKYQELTKDFKPGVSNVLED